MRRVFDLLAACALLTACSSDVTAPESVPQRFTDVAAGDAHTCATTIDRQTYCWGSAAQARLGHDATDDACEAGICTRPVAIRSDLRLTNLTAGAAHTCGFVRQHAWCWGFDRFGQLGDDGGVLTKCGDDRPFFCSLDPALVGVGTPLVQITADRHHTCALDDAGRALCWGGNAVGQIGHGTPHPETAYPQPRYVEQSPSFVRLETGFGHTCGIDAEGAAWCWGSNEVGRLGTGDTADRATPARVAGDLAFERIGVGGSFTCAITPTGEVYCWGWAFQGRLGIGGNPWMYTEPVRNLMPEPAVALSAGQHHTCAIAESGTLYCWGANFNGQLGVPGGEFQSVPVEVSLPAAVERVSAGFVHTCAITVDEQLFCWGDNEYGQLGAGDSPMSDVPLLVNP